MTKKIIYSDPVKLAEAIERGTGDKKQKIESVKIRKPMSGELRGLRLVDLANADVSSMITVIPRISEPALTEQELSEMDPSDFSNLAIEVVGFLEAKNATL